MRQSVEKCAISQC